MAKIQMALEPLTCTEAHTKMPHLVIA